jgi:hypothetical protein
MFLNPLSKRKTKSGRLEYVKSTRHRNWLIPLLIYVFTILIPFYYECRTEIPPDATLNETEGTFFYRRVGKPGYLVELTNEGRKDVFTCRENMTIGNKHDCLPHNLDAGPLNGKMATVWWFDQEIYPFIHQRRLVRLIVDGKLLVSRAKTVASAETSAGQAPWVVIGALILFVFFTWYFGFRHLRKIEQHEQQHS